jgi:L-fucose/D-arabinose isomerase
MKPFWEITAAEVKACLAAPPGIPSITEYFPGGGWSTRFATRGGMPATIARLNLVKGLGPALQLAEGWTVELPAKVHDALDERTNPTWPTTWFCPRVGRRGLPRHLLGDERLGCQPLRDELRPHRRRPGRARRDAADPGLHAQRAGEALFRPSAWTAHGTADAEGADFRACANYGPLYG